MGSSLTTDTTQHGVRGASCMMLMPVLWVAALFAWGLHHGGCCIVPCMVEKAGWWHIALGVAKRLVLLP